MDYLKYLGLNDLPIAYRGGIGTKIAILDSGSPIQELNGGRCSCSYGHKGCLDDHFGHATEISSILFGGSSIVGICPHAQPFYFKVLDDSGIGRIDSVVEGINRAVDYGVDIINLSLGFARTNVCPRALEKACSRACKSGKTIICAAGNDSGPVNWPAALDTTICVGSSDENEWKASFSSTGEVDFVAPGTNLPVLGKDGKVVGASGTSFSAAIVTGIAALCISYILHRQGVRPTVDTVKQSLIYLSKDIDAPGWDERTGYGLISGGHRDITVCQKIERGFFGKILDNIRSRMGWV